ncbi:peptidase associated/transthyretin-like domain-containing protein [Maribacter flavus]|uniref:Uncharacterized protein n=1 Tax=Maribacter flavus TaxID=1658664 RepID=A0A5B2TSW3_9FLAO|nr:hypothetical protein [Maribacter flavus]KAA2216530.1 hypothetical protein F0361_11025 [Maribacter flavus]
MKNNQKRRNFLKGSVLASTGAMLLPTTDLFAKESSSSYPSISTADIRTKLFGKQVEISGQVFDVSGKNPLQNAKVEFWHLSPNSKQIGHKGLLITDSEGKYLLRTDYPSREMGKHTTIHFRVSMENEELVTELKFSDFGAFITDKHWESNQELDNDLLFPQLEKSIYKTKINFNFSINQ